MCATGWLSSATRPPGCPGCKPSARTGPATKTMTARPPLIGFGKSSTRVTGRAAWTHTWPPVMLTRPAKCRHKPARSGDDAATKPSPPGVCDEHHRRHRTFSRPSGEHPGVARCRVPGPTPPVRHHRRQRPRRHHRRAGLLFAMPSPGPLRRLARHRATTPVAVGRGGRSLRSTTPATPVARTEAPAGNQDRQSEPMACRLPPRRASAVHAGLRRRRRHRN